MLTVSVKNLGPIAEGVVDLKPLTIFVGPSNTGKSYMAMAVYSVMRALRDDSFVPPRRMVLGGWMYNNKGFSGPLAMPDENSDVVNAVLTWAKQLNEAGLNPRELTVSGLPDNVRAGLENITVQELSLVCTETIRQFIQVFGNPDEFVSKGAQPKDFRLVVHQDEPRLNLDIPLQGEGSTNFKFDISGAQIEPFPLEFLARLDDQPVFGSLVVMDSWLGSLWGKVLEGVPYDSYYLPAARSGIVQGHKFLAAEIVRRAARMGQQGHVWNTLPGITTEFLGNMISLDRRLGSQGRSGDLDEAVSFIENEVLQGKIDLDESGELPMPELVYMPTGVQSGTGKFTLDRTSSMVQELAPLILFLKYLVHPGDLLILEEPESHLHPAAQRRMAQGIVRLVNAGVKVIITTHSDIFLSQINNLIRISHASKRWLREKGFDPRDCLKRDEAGAYQFAWDAEVGGSVVKELKVTTDGGIENDAFDDVIHDLYEESVLVERIRIK